MKKLMLWVDRNRGTRPLSRPRRPLRRRRSRTARPPPGPTNPWPGKGALKVSFFVETVTASKNESVWGLWANTACTRTNFFPRRERIVWHITMVDTKTGKVIEAADVKYAYLKIPGLANLKLKYGPHGRDPLVAPWNWYYGWDVPPDYPLGLVTTRSSSRRSP